MISRFALGLIVTGAAAAAVACQTHLGDQWARSNGGSDAAAPLAVPSHATTDSARLDSTSDSSPLASNSAPLTSSNEIPPSLLPPPLLELDCDGGDCPEASINPAPDCSSELDACESECPPGTHTAPAPGAATDARCVPCAEGTFSATPDALTCQAWQRCSPGTFLASPGDDIRDAICEGCASGSFSDTVDAPRCQAWTTCMPGTHVAEPGDATRDRRCAACPPGQSSLEQNSGACIEAGACPAGTVEVVATAGALTECEACEAGSYCAGGDNAAEPCAADTWDDDENPATPCVARSICSAGYFVTDPGGLTEDRSCEPCPNGAFSAAPNADQCTPWTECPAGSSVASAGTRTRDRTCQECSAGHYTSQANSPSCSAWATCSAPSQYMTQPPSSTRDRSCSTCQAPALTREDNATSCLVPAFRMSNGRVVMEAEHYHFTTSQGSTDAWYPIQLAGVSNGRCVELGPDDGDLHAWLDDVAATAPRLDYYVDFDEAGTFDLFLRGDAGVASWGASNSCHAGLNDQPLADYFDFPQQNHQWRWISHPLIVPSAGIHRVQIWGREDGFRLDKIVIQRPSSAPPSGHGPAESSTH